MPILRKAYLVYANLAPTPGVFHTENSALEYLRRMFDDRLWSYNTTVAHAPASIEVYSDRRRAFIVYMDLNGFHGDGIVSAQSAARHMLRETLRDVIGHYDPVVAIAPATLQPANNITGVLYDNATETETPSNNEGNTQA